ncbi:MAG: 5-(carboxyamino)imidazole ribonucleotide synthase [Conexivisphaera sp.]
MAECAPRVGILGGGQLGWMMILEGRKLGISFGVLDLDPSAPASRIADRAFSPREGSEFLSWSDVVTYEFENVDAGIAREADARGRLRPGLLPLLAKQDRIREKSLLVELGIPTADFRVAHSPEELAGMVRASGPLIVKAIYGGYDGKGVRTLGNPEEVRSLEWGYPVLVEELVDVEAEISVLVARSQGEEAIYPAAENHNADGILLYSIAPARGPAVDIASGIALRLARAMDYVGVLAVEFLVSRDGRVLVNEFAPRVHNTGHWTLCGAATSQFENHLRAVLDLPLGSTELLRPTGIVNVLGISRDSLRVHDLLSIPGTKLWWYGKAEARPRRKMGHVCVVAGSDDELRGRVREIMAKLYGDVSFPPFSTSSSSSSLGAASLGSEVSHDRSDAVA